MTQVKPAQQAAPKVPRPPSILLTPAKVKAEIAALPSMKLSGAEHKRRLGILQDILLLLETKPSGYYIHKERERYEAAIARITDQNNYDDWVKHNSVEHTKIIVKRENPVTYYREKMGLATFQRHLWCATAILTGRFDW